MEQIKLESACVRCYKDECREASWEFFCNLFFVCFCRENWNQMAKLPNEGWGLNLWKVVVNTEKIKILNVKGLLYRINLVSLKCRTPLVHSGIS